MIAAQPQGPMGELVNRTISSLPWAEQFFIYGVVIADPWDVVAEARAHLSKRSMTIGDIHAWQMLGAAMEDLLDF